MTFIDNHHDFECSCGQPKGKHHYFCDSEPVILDEMYYKDFANAIYPNSVVGAHVTNLATRDWAGLIPYVKYTGYRGDTMAWYVPNKWNGWDSYTKWMEWDSLVTDTSINPVEAARLLLWGSSLRVHCSCPSYLFHYQYVLTQLDAAIYPEERPSNKTNPNGEFGPCKHCRRVIKVLPFHLGKFAAAIKETRSRIERGLPLTVPPTE